MNLSTCASRPAARLVSALLLAASAGSAADTLTLAAADTILSVNEQVVVTVSLSGATPFSVWGQCLTWDTTKLSLVRQEAVSTPFGIKVNDSRLLTDINASGQVRTGGYYEGAGQTYPNNAGGTHALATLTFVRIEAGITTLTAQTKDGTYPFGAVVITAGGTERIPGADAAVTFTDPAASVAGDLNSDGVVTFPDLSLFLSTYEKSLGDSGYLPGANLNNVGSSLNTVNFEDLAAFLALYEG